MKQATKAEIKTARDKAAAANFIIDETLLKSQMANGSVNEAEAIELQLAIEAAKQNDIAKQAAEKAEAEAKAKAEAAKKPAPTSAKLLELQAAAKQHKLNARNFDVDSDEETAELLAAYNIGLQIKAEIANIVLAEKTAEMQLKRNERIALNNAQFVALFGTAEAFEAFKAAMTAEAADTFIAAKTIVDNELLAKYAAVTPTKAKAAETTGTKAATTDSAANEAMVIANIAAGMTDNQNRAALQAAGIPRSTAWHALNNYKKAHGLAKA